MAEDSYEQLLICPVCMDQYRQPKILKCHHSFCKRCLEHIPQEQEDGRTLINCPVCRKPTRLPDGNISLLTHSFFVENLLEIYQVMEKEKSDRDGEYWSCPDHNKELDCYCNDCNVLICVHCIYRKHQNHNTQLIADCFEHNVDDIKEELDNVKQRLDTVQNSLRLLDDLDVSFVKESSNVEKQINIFADSMIEKINHFREGLSNEVRAATQKKRNAVKLQKDSLLDTLIKLQVSHSSVEKIITMGSQKKTLASKTQMLQQLKLAHQEFDIDLLKPVESYDVKFQCNFGNPLDGLGTIKYSHLHKKFTASGKALKYAHTLSTASFKIDLVKGEDLIGALPISMVTVDITPYTVVSPIEKISPEVFKATYMPIKHDVHKISVKIGGEEVDNSPFTVQILPYFQRVEIPLSEIRVLAPRGICVTNRGWIVVSEYPQDAINEHIKLSLSSSINQDRLTKEEHFTILKNNGTKKEIQCPFPSGVVAAGDNHFLVVDKRNSCIRKFKDDGRPVAIGVIGKMGTFRYLNGIAVNRNGLVAVTEVNSASIHIFNRDLTYLTEIGGDYSTPFFHPTGVAFDSEGNMYVTDCGYNKVFKLDSSYNVLTTFGQKGSKNERLDQPMAIAIDRNDVLYIADTKNDRISIFNKTGQFLTCFGNEGDELDKLSRPCGLAVCVTGKVYISDTGKDRVVVFN